MSDHWFYIQRWKESRSEREGKERRTTEGKKNVYDEHRSKDKKTTP
jgi:hypothetical protein